MSLGQASRPTSRLSSSLPASSSESEYEVRLTSLTWGTAGPRHDNNIQENLKLKIKKYQPRMFPIIMLSLRAELSSEVRVIPINNLQEITGKTLRSRVSSVSTLHQTRVR